MSTILRSLKLMIGADFTQAQAGFKQAAKELKATGKSFSETGSTLTKGVTLPVVGAVASLGALVGKSLDTADSLAKMSDVTGLSIERLQELKYAGTQLDVELETITGSQSKLIRAMSAAEKGTGDQAAAFKELGINIKNSDGTLRNSNEVFAEAIDRLGQMKSETDRDALALKLFGKSAMELNPLIKAGGTELARLTQEAHKNGAVMSGESVKALDEFGDSLEAAKLSLGKAGQEIAVALLPSLQKLLPTVKDAIIPAVKSLADMVKGLVDGFNSLSPTMQKTVLTLGGLAVGAGPALSAVGGLTTSLSKLMTKASAAAGALKDGKGLTGALSSLVGPGGMVVLGVAAIAALGTAMVVTKDKMEASAKEARALGKAVDDSVKAYDNATKEAETNAKVANQLTGELYNLAAKESKSNAEKARMASIVAQLNQLVPDLNLKIDKQTGALDRNEKSVRDLIAAKKVELQLTATQNGLIEGYKKRVELADKLAESQARVAEIQKKMDANPMGASYFKAEMKFAQDALNEATRAASTNEAQIRRLEGANEDLEMSVYKMGDAFNEAGKAASGAGEQLKALTDEDKKLNEAWSKERTKIYEDSLKEQADLFTLYYGQIEDAAKTHMDEMGGIEDKGITKTKLTAQQVKKNLEAQIQDFRNWRNEIARLSQRVPEDVMTELRKLGPEATPIIQGLNKMTDKDLNAWIQTWRTKASLAKDAAIDEVGDIPAAMREAGRDAGQGFADGLRSKLEIVKAEAAKLGKVVPYSVRRILEIESPSKVMRGIGEYTSEGMAIGIRDNVGLVKAASAEMSNAAMSTPLQGRAIEPRVTGMETVMPNIMQAVNAGGGGGDVSLVINVGGKTVLDTVLTEAQRRNARSGRQVIAVGV